MIKKFKSDLKTGEVVLFSDIHPYDNGEGSSDEEEPTIQLYTMLVSPVEKNMDWLELRTVTITEENHIIKGESVFIPFDKIKKLNQLYNG